MSGYARGTLPTFRGCIIKADIYLLLYRPNLPSSILELEIWSLDSCPAPLTYIYKIIWVLVELLANMAITFERLLKIFHRITGFYIIKLHDCYVKIISYNDLL